MSGPWNCARLEAAAAELALGLVDGPDRADALAHLEGCGACRSLVSDLTRVVDHLTLVGPVEEPPPGFEGRVLARLGSEAASGDAALPAALGGRRVPRGPNWRRPATSGFVKLLAAAAVLVVAVLAGVTLAGRHSTGSAEAAVREAPMVTPMGETVGKVDLGGTPRTVLVSLPGWYSPGGAAASYRLRLTLADGSHHDFASVSLSDGGVWSAATTIDAAGVRSVSLLDSTGRLVCHAHLSSS